MDSFGRVIDYLRISVTDRCNERCLYCMPEGYKGWAQKADHLTADEIIRVAEAACRLGFRKFRLTGGEPCIRKDLVQIASGISRQPGVRSLGVSTNGTRLTSLAAPLREAGVDSVNISLDTLDPALYRKITGGEVSAVHSGIQAALAAGIPRIKLNCVLMRGINEGEIWPLIHFAAERELPIRFIELMPVSRTDVLTEENFLSVQEVMLRLAERDELSSMDSPALGHGPARYYRLSKVWRDGRFYRRNDDVRLLFRLQQNPSDCRRENPPVPRPSQRTGLAWRSPPRRRRGGSGAAGGHRGQARRSRVR